MTLDEAFKLAESVHCLVDSTDDLCFLTLVCLGTDNAFSDDNDTHWTASFASAILNKSINEGWYDNPDRFPYSARAESPAEAIRLAAEKVFERYLSGEILEGYLNGN